MLTAAFMRTQLILALVGTLSVACNNDTGTGTDSDGSTGAGGNESSSGDAPTTSGGTSPTAATTSGGTDSGTGGTTENATDSATGVTTGVTTGETTGETTGGDDPFAAEPMCSSGKTWTKGNEESPQMNPGQACLTCHSKMEPKIAMRFPIVGTVYPTGHEPDNCLGLDGLTEQVFVEITMADARVVKLPVNESGNFLYDVKNDGGAVMFPFTARVLQGDLERKMLGPQTTGDCNSCHTQTGANGAPGRIVAP